MTRYAVPGFDPDDETDWTALHEGAHVVAALNFGGELIAASVRGNVDKGYSGQTWLAEIDLNDEHALEQLAARALTCLAAPAAEHAWEHGELASFRADPEHHDVAHARTCLELMTELAGGDPDAMPDGPLDQAAAVVVKWMRRPKSWRAVCLIAELLREEKTVTSVDVRRAMAR